MTDARYRALCGLVAAILSMPGCDRQPHKPRAQGTSSQQPEFRGDLQAAQSAAAMSASSIADTPESRQARASLVRHIQDQAPWGEPSWSPRVLDAMQRVPRHVFLPGVGIATAYRDAPYPIGHDQTISQPSMVALMTNALALHGGEKVLEIGTGSGYQAAVLAELVAELYTIELVAPLGESARERLALLGYRNVQLRIGDGYAGWPEHAPFDRIILTAAPPEMPAALIDQLRENGTIVAPVGRVHQELVRWHKHAGKLEQQRLGAVRFVPMLRGADAD